MDPIDRQDAVRIVDNIDTWQAGWRGNAIESLKALPPVQPERKTGRWVGNPETCEFMTCSACGCEFDWVSEGGYPSNEWAYCPECGAFMGGEQNEAD